LKERKKALDSKLLVGRIQKEKQMSPIIYAKVGVVIFVLDQIIFCY